MIELNLKNNVDFYYKSSHYSIYDLIDGVLYQKGFSCICSNEGEEYFLFQKQSDKSVYVEMNWDYTYIVFNEKGDFVEVRNDYYSIIGALIHHKIIDMQNIE